jgi:hypothetical protein
VVDAGWTAATNRHLHQAYMASHPAIDALAWLSFTSRPFLGQRSTELALSVTSTSTTRSHRLFALLRTDESRGPARAKVFCM